ncbi:MAG: hypothetical protein DLM57_00185 [Pseudonocardiales bacterium]|nr:MAG: hypothetical protein DLM57_00185 [Pseudonocardiales bacterium]
MVVKRDRDAEESKRHTRLEELFTRHYGELSRFASRRVGPDAAPDIVSNTFLIAWRRLDEVPTETSRAWLFRTARHVIANEVRGRRRRELLGARLGLDAEPIERDPSAAVTERLRIRAVLDRLSPQDQEVLRLVEWDRLTIAEGAQVMGCTRAAFKVRLLRARRRCAAALLAEQPSQATVATVPGVAVRALTPTHSEGHVTHQ